MTKAEFLDQLASDDRLGGEKAASDAVDAMLETIAGALSKGERGQPSPASANSTSHERGPRQGINPRTGERITIPGGKVPRFSPVRL